jgi:tRNA pseudouridine38-40 synthase
MRIRIVLEYDGTDFCGWQFQDGVRTVQGTLECAVLKVFGGSERIRVEGAGRTDSGVHSLGQVAHFDVEDSVFEKRWRDHLNRVPLALNFHLKGECVVVLSAELAPAGFHSRFSAILRSYRYVVHNRNVKSVILQNRAWHVPGGLDIAKMNEAAGFLIGKHNFESFRSAHCQATNPVRTISKFEIQQSGNLIYFDVSARSFLHMQVRIMVGTLAQVGKGKHPPEHIQHILTQRDRSNGGPTAPPHGLYLAEVEY